MRPDAIRKLDAFRKGIDPFMHFWKSILLRAVWAHMDEKDRILALSITVEEKAAGELQKPIGCPEVGGLHASWEARDIGKLDDVLNELREGSVRIAGQALLIECYSSNKWEKWGSFWFHFNRPGEYAGFDSRCATISLRGSDSGKREASESLAESVIAPLFKELHPPFVSMQDVLVNWLGIPGDHSDQNQVVVALRAEVPVVLIPETRIRGGRMSIGVEMPRSGIPEKVSIGLIEYREGEVLRRGTLPLERTCWSEEASGWKMQHLASVSDEATSTVLLLRYAGVFLAQQTASAFGDGRTPATLKVQSVFDPKNAEFLKALAGTAVKNQGEHFEQAVSWLFGHCGFVTHLYGLYHPFGEDAVDVTAYSQDVEVLLAIECAVSHPKALGKMPKLVARCRRVQATLTKAGVEVLPVLAFALDEVSESEQDAARKDGIAILSAKSLLHILEMAGAGKRSRDVVAYVRSLIGTTKFGPTLDGTRPQGER